MKTFNSIQKIQEEIQTLKAQGLSIGLVPTMGALHDGHISLIKKCNEESDITVCSIFVNPTQFNDSNDLANYPKTLDSDLEMLKSNNCNLVFIPTAEEMYPSHVSLKISFGELESNLEGEKRPGHFNGVGIVVSKLFNIIQPHNAYFGQKDLQQVAIINSLVNQLSYPIKITTCPISRESNGLARSSRNERLKSEDRAHAGFIFECLNECKSKINSQNIESVEKEAIQLLEEKDCEVEYVSIINMNNFSPAKSVIPNETAICAAVWLGGVRLIDNIIL